MKQYKVWVEIEECDEEADVYVTVSAFPVCVGVFGTLDEADDAIAALTGQSTK